MKRATDPDVLLLQATADPTRLSILRQLSEQGDVCACDFTACCEVGQPTISHHLKVLRDAGWVTTQRDGTWIWYSLDPAAVARFHQIAQAILPGAARPVAMLRASHAAGAAAVGGQSVLPTRLVPPGFIAPVETH
jgi:ArsR family transcriptional regulator